MLDNIGKSPFLQLVYEADIDWILCLELNCSPQFRSWLGSKIFDFEPQHSGAWRSVSDPFLGESDLVWLVIAPDGTLRIALIENKINAIAQPMQFERYVLRGKDFVAQEICSSFTTVLVSPQGYKSADSDDYERQISYEDIQKYYESDASEHNQYLASLFGSALSKSLSSPPPNPEITNYRHQVWQLADTEFPELQISEPKPTSEYWVCQAYPDFYIKYKLYTKSGAFVRSVVDLELPGKGDQVESLTAQYSEDLNQLGAKVVAAGKSAAFRIEVPCADPRYFEKDTARRALKEWKKLFTWWQKRSSA